MWGGFDEWVRCRCLFYEFVTRETLVQLKEGEGEFDVLMKLFRVVGYPGVEEWKRVKGRMIVPCSKTRPTWRCSPTARITTVNSAR